jgi:hypothetical protein
MDDHHFCYITKLPKKKKKKTLAAQRTKVVVLCKEICVQLAKSGQSEPVATNAPVGRSVHWMGCVFSFDAGRGSSQSITFSC